MSGRLRWACPKCGATDNHGGFYCYCDGEQADDHGETLSNPCLDASCDACGWSGTFPTEPDPKDVESERLRSLLVEARDALRREAEGRSPNREETHALASLLARLDEEVGRGP